MRAEDRHQQTVFRAKVKCRNEDHEVWVVDHKLWFKNHTKEELAAAATMYRLGEKDPNTRRRRGRFRCYEFLREWQKPHSFSVRHIPRPLHGYRVQRLQTRWNRSRPEADATRTLRNRTGPYAERMFRRCDYPSFNSRVVNFFDSGHRRTVSGTTRDSFSVHNGRGTMVYMDFKRWAWLSNRNLSVVDGFFVLGPAPGANVMANGSLKVVALRELAKGATWKDVHTWSQQEVEGPALLPHLAWLIVGGDGPHLEWRKLDTMLDYNVAAAAGAPSPWTR